MPLTRDYVIEKDDMPSAGYSSRRFDYVLDRVRGEVRDVVVVGFGRPFELQRARELGMNAVGIDRDVSGIDMARELGFRVVLAEADQGMPLDEGSVDLVLAHHVIEHMEDPEGFMDECHRVLRPGGHLAVETPDIRRNRFFYDDPTHLRPFDQRSLESLVARRFTVEWSQLFAPLPVVWRYALFAFRAPNLLGLGRANLLVIGRKAVP